MDEQWYMKTPMLRGLSRLINLYYYFKIGYEANLAPDLAQYILPDDELRAMQELIGLVRLKEQKIKELEAK